MMRWKIKLLGIRICGSIVVVVRGVQGEEKEEAFGVKKQIFFNQMTVKNLFSQTVIIFVDKGIK